MRKIAPQITRQRLLMEGYYRIDVSRTVIADYFRKISKALKLKTYGEPIIFSPGGAGREINQGYDAFIPLIDSGISLYVWSNARFMSVIIYTCKNFDEKKAVEFTREFWKIDKIETQSF
ncbi:MAG: S-adenosylmethionine decarboxylase [Candidatus Altiarchaeota archaeon]